MNKHLFYIPLIALAAICLIALPACDDDDNNSNTQQETFSITPDSLSFPKMGGTLALTINSATEPTLLAQNPWLKTTLASSEGSSYTFNVTAEAYTTGTANRTSSITVLAGENSAEVAINQNYTMSQSFDVDATGGTVAPDVQTTTETTITIDALWITDNGDGTYTAMANSNNSTRTGYIIYKLDSSSDTISIVQAAGAEPTLSLSSTAMELAQYMYPAWNLGNTMEATGSGLGCETSWQSTKTTQEIIDFVKASGFKSVRIPCSWYIHCPKRTSTDYTIDATWIARVKEIVDYCINDGLFVELNDHWDSGWLEELGFSSSSSTYTSVIGNDEYINGKIEILQTLWTQIATEFSNYDHHLIFAGLNEPFQNYSLFNGRAESLTPILLKYNQAFVDAVRATGGNNAERVLAVQGPATNIDYTLSYFQMPTDAASNKLFVEVHYYDPYNFTLNTGSGYTTTWNAESSVKTSFAKLKSKFADNNIPVILGEYGANWRGGLATAKQTSHDNSIYAFYKTINKWGPNNGIVPFVWDTNYCPAVRNASDKSTMTIINRASVAIYNPYAYAGITEGSNATAWMK